MPLLPDLARAALRFWQVPLSDRIDFFRAMVELGRARRRLHRVPASQIVTSENPEAPSPTEVQAATARRIGVAIRRASRYVPWRSDCLVQALAAQAWLKRKGVSTWLRVGVQKIAEAERPYAHAWLLCGNSVVTGGDVSTFSPFAPTPQGSVMDIADTNHLSG
jgi:hypothetical protein